MGSGRKILIDGTFRILQQLAQTKHTAEIQYIFLEEQSQWSALFYPCDEYKILYLLGKKVLT